MRVSGVRLSKNDSSSSRSTARSIPGLTASTLRRQLVARLVALDEELAGVGDDVGVGQDPLAVDDDAGAAGLLRAVLGPGMGQVGIPHRRGDLHDRIADLRLLASSWPAGRRPEPGRVKTDTMTRAGTARAAAVIQPEIIRGIFIAGTRFWLPNANRERPLSRPIAPVHEQTRPIRPGKRPGISANSFRSSRSYRLPSRLGSVRCQSPVSVHKTSDLPLPGDAIAQGLTSRISILPAIATTLRSVSEAVDHPLFTLRVSVEASSMTATRSIVPI